MNLMEIALLLILASLPSIGWLLAFLDRRRTAAWEEYNRDRLDRRAQVERNSRRVL
ncbi:hypothetical protein [Pseudomonas nitroreducens]|uniref:Uncharacterized protein n=1 Tax=Pseudomonas nitroreducens TaxID=46680 RepID=A0A6G6IZ28_PSENT|nr:hypothetical protein [Pseudomonas nitroreducens]QIE88060.1 hypothetical protein G5B91_17995 [Pseudomonas nitroreducens]